MRQQQQQQQAMPSSSHSDWAQEMQLQQQLSRRHEEEWLLLQQQQEVERLTATLNVTAPGAVAAAAAAATGKKKQTASQGVCLGDRVELDIDTRKVGGVITGGPHFDRSVNIKTDEGEHHLYCRRHRVTRVAPLSRRSSVQSNGLTASSFGSFSRHSSCNSLSLNARYSFGSATQQQQQQQQQHPPLPARRNSQPSLMGMPPMAHFRQCDAGGPPLARASSGVLPMPHAFGGGGRAFGQQQPQQHQGSFAAAAGQHHHQQHAQQQQQQQLHKRYRRNSTGSSGHSQPKMWGGNPFMTERDMALFNKTPPMHSQGFMDLGMGSDSLEESVMLDDY